MHRKWFDKMNTRYITNTRSYKHKHGLSKKTRNHKHNHAHKPKNKTRGKPRGPYFSGWTRASESGLCTRHQPVDESAGNDRIPSAGPGFSKLLAESGLCTRSQPVPESAGDSRIPLAGPDFPACLRNPGSACGVSHCLGSLSSVGVS